MRGISGISVATCLFIFVTGCHTGQKKSLSTDSNKYILPDSLYKTLQIDTVGSCKVVNMVTLTGQVDYNEDNVVKIYPLVSGLVTGVQVMLGDYVHKGQELAVVHSMEMAGYSSELVSAKTNLEVARKNLQVTIDMYHSGLASQKDSLSAVASFDQARAELNRVNEILSISDAGASSGNEVIRSPINGFIVEKTITNNTMIRPDNGNNLFTISDLRNIWVIANVYESNITDIHLGDSVHITTLAYPDRIFAGKVDKMMDVLDPVNKVMKVRIVLNNPGYLLKPEMFASVKVINPENRDMLCIPQKAVVFDNSRYYVLLYRNNSHIIITPVKVDMSGENRYYISGGLKVGDRIIGSQTLLIYQALNT
ncbi:MAG TPA: efflux RND transporter periplasmic adaptor subunit [Chitinophagaceae bacterium]|nr:efflux RND transporter periplasmic adaptor subunit [Chitinophagaceae bacterium]